MSRAVVAFWIFKIPWYLPLFSSTSSFLNLYWIGSSWNFKSLVASWNFKSLVASWNFKSLVAWLSNISSLQLFMHDLGIDKRSYISSFYQIFSSFAEVDFFTVPAIKWMQYNRHFCQELFTVAQNTQENYILARI